MNKDLKALYCLHKTNIQYLFDDEGNLYIEINDMLVEVAYYKFSSTPQKNK